MCPPDAVVVAAGAGPGEAPRPLPPVPPRLGPRLPVLFLLPSSPLLPGWPRRRRDEEPGLVLVALIEPGVNAGADADNPGTGASPLMLVLTTGVEIECAPSSEIVQERGNCS